MLLQWCDLHQAYGIEHMTGGRNLVGFKRTPCTGTNWFGFEVVVESYSFKDNDFQHLNIILIQLEWHCFVYADIDADT